MRTPSSVTVSVELDERSVVAVETLLSDIEFHARGLRESLNRYRDRQDWVRLHRADVGPPQGVDPST
jgi:hypothetical protein